MPRSNRFVGRYDFVGLSLRRITSGGAYIPEIDGLRFIAIASVVVFHCFMQTELPLFWGGRPFLLDHLRRGVELFFVISGFVLGAPFARFYLAQGQPVRIGSYFARRLTRLEPPFILILCIRAVALLIGTHAAGRVLTHFLWSVVYGYGLRYGA